MEAPLSVAAKRSFGKFPLILGAAALAAGALAGTDPELTLARLVPLAMPTESAEVPAGEPALEAPVGPVTCRVTGTLAGIVPDGSGGTQVSVKVVDTVGRCPSGISGRVVAGLSPLPLDRVVGDIRAKGIQNGSPVALSFVRTHGGLVLSDVAPL